MAAGVNVKKPRIQSIDILKGGAIIGVVAAHLMIIRKLLPKNITEIIEDEEAAANTDISTTPYK